MEKSVAIVVLNYRNWEDTIECLASIFECHYEKFRVIIVDNDSKNDSLENIADWLNDHRKPFVKFSQQEAETVEFINATIVLIQAVTNSGYASGCNIGIRWAIRANDEYVMILNNDTLVGADFLKPLVDFLDQHINVALVGPKIMNPHGLMEKSCARRRLTIFDFVCRNSIVSIFFPKNRYCLRHYYIGEHVFIEPTQVDVISGSCMLLRSNLLRQIDLLDENTFMYSEEFILHEKIRKLTMLTYLIPQSQILHKGGQSTKAMPSWFTHRERMRSRAYYLNQYRHYAAWFIQLLLLNERIYYALKVVYCAVSLRIKKKNNMAKQGN